MHIMLQKGATHLKHISDYIKNHKYCLAMLYFLLYLPAFYILEQIDGAKTIIHCPLDDAIPFIAPFIFPYFSWHLLFPLMLIFLMIKDKDAFLELCFVMFTGMTVSLIVYLIFPNGLDIRTPIIGNSIPERLCAFLYSADTPTNVFPSIHVSSTVAIALAVRHSKMFYNHRTAKISIYILCTLIILSTLFVKQHSVYDVLVGAVLSLMIYRAYVFILSHKKLDEASAQEI